MRSLLCLVVLPGVLLITGVLTACSNTPDSSGAAVDIARLPSTEPMPFQQPPSRLGNPMIYNVFGEEYRVLSTSEGYRQRGIASWYGQQFHGNSTSSGVTYDMHAQTAAHKTLPIPTFVRVTRLDNGRSIVVEVNDRGPFVDDRIIDLSYAAATQLGMTEQGLAQVEVVALPPYQYLAWHQPSSASQLADTGRGTAQPLSASASVMAHSSALRTDQAFLQVGAFSQRQSAENLRQRLSQRLGPAVQVANTDDALYRVRIGPLQGPDDVDRLRLALVEFGIHAIYLTQD